ncbi:phospholipase A2 homolog EPL_00195-like [Anolis carolinensis]|uniref:phospholipase A2 homolog EPL_00195-like n=1 Tax=Anolis carolinensis TaxID=28377 RepID=UPI002F2B7D69
MGRTSLFQAVVVVFCVSTVPGKEEEREKMVTDVIKVNGSLFRSYGCYCGTEGLGSGEPKDYIDMCCQILNCCYEVLKGSRCDAKATSYKYIYDGENVECWMANNFAWCKANVCSCDRHFSLCLLDAHGLFNRDHLVSSSGPRACGERNPTECNVEGSSS